MVRRSHARPSVANMRRGSQWIRSVSSQLPRSHGLTQVELAERMAISQSDLSKLERRRDTRLSSLRAYAAALGGGISIVFRSNASGASLQLSSET